MINWFSTWAQSIIIAVIMATIIEIVLPKGSIKKYVNVVIGIYIVFTIVSPILEKVSGGNLDFSKMIDQEVYAKELEESSNKINSKLENINSKTIKDIYIENLEKDIKAKINIKGYETRSVVVEIKEDGKYTIEKIRISMYKDSLQNNISNNVEENSVGFLKKAEIKKYIAESYDIKENIITIE